MGLIKSLQKHPKYQWCRTEFEAFLNIYSLFSSLILSQINKEANDFKSITLMIAKNIKY